MPEARPLVAISQVRSGGPAMLNALMLKTQFLRQRDRLPVVGDRYRRRTSLEASDAGHRRPSR